MNRHEYRLKLVEVLYQNLLLNKSINVIIKEQLEDIPVDAYFKKVLKYYIDNKEKMIEEISVFLNKWNFNRLNFVSQSIILLAASEISLNIEDKAIIIDEAIIISKAYCDEEDYKYINGVLDNYVKRNN